MRTHSPEQPYLKLNPLIKRSPNIEAEMLTHATGLRFKVVPEKVIIDSPDAPLNRVLLRVFHPHVYRGVFGGVVQGGNYNDRYNTTLIQHTPNGNQTDRYVALHENTHGLVLQIRPELASIHDATYSDPSTIRDPHTNFVLGAFNEGIADWCANETVMVTEKPDVSEPDMYHFNRAAKQLTDVTQSVASDPEAIYQQELEHFLEFTKSTQNIKSLQDMIAFKRSEETKRSIRAKYWIGDYFAAVVMASLRLNGFDTPTALKHFIENAPTTLDQLNDPISFGYTLRSSSRPKP